VTGRFGPALPSPQRTPRRWFADCFRKLIHALLVVLTFTPPSVQAAAPALDGFFPAGVNRGTTTVTALGANEGWPPKVWVNKPGVIFNAQTNKGKFLVAVEENAAAGPYLVRFYNDEGASEPRCLVVDSGFTIADAEPNNHFRKPQALKQLPVTINGRLEKSGDVDSFSLDMKAGQWLEASVQSHVLMSKVDAALRLMTTNGVQLAWNHDFISIDPRLVWLAHSNQTVVLQIFGFAYPFASEIRLAGGDSAIYRLQVNASDTKPEPCPIHNEETDRSGLTNGVVPLPFTTHGKIAAPGREERFRFKAAKGEFVALQVEAAAFGSPLDAWLRVEDAAGNELARNDDASGSHDPRLEWKAASNGVFTAAVGSVTHHGGEDFCYRLSIHRAPPAIDVVLSSSSLVLKGATTNSVKLEVKRLRGHTNEVSVSVRGLPPCVNSVATNLPSKDGTFSLPLVVDDDVCQYHGPVHVFLKDHFSGEEMMIPFKLTTRGETAYGRLLVEESEEFWLTSGPEKKKAKPPQEKK
jgi:hypothetical protein